MGGSTVHFSFGYPLLRKDELILSSKMILIPCPCPPSSTRLHVVNIQCLISA